jgi:vitamin B12 transporter
MKSILIHSLAGAALAATTCGPAQAQNPSSPNPTPSLEPQVVTATRFPLPPEQVGHAVTSFRTEELETSRLIRAEDVFRLGLVPGAAFATSGQTGSLSSLFLRGTNRNQTQFLVDGVRINDANLVPDFFLGGETLANVGGIEILRGPQSGLYGGEAIGGVVNVLTARGTGAPASAFEATAGSFGTFGTRFSSAGALDGFTYSLGAGWNVTANDRPHNDFESLTHAGRFDVPLGEATSLGFTFRSAQRSFQSPGSTAENDPDNREEEEFLLFTAFLEHQFNEVWNTRLLGGWLDQDLGFRFPPSGSSITDQRKANADWRHTLAWSDRLVTLAGIAHEQSAVRNTGFGAIDDADSITALYFQQTVRPWEPLTLTGNARWERYDTFGDAFTWRGSAAHRLAATATTLRASAGTGFRAPSFFELYARDAFFVGNPALRPEESFGWDAGLTQDVASLGQLSLTWFANELTDLVTTDFAAFPATVTNLASANTSGAEAEFAGRAGERLHYRLAYTYLHAADGLTGARLLRRPRHTLGVDTHAAVSDRLTLGAGLTLIHDRLDIDPVTFSTIRGSEHALVRLYGRYRIHERVETHLTVENALDERYDEIAGFPGRGPGVFAGFTVRF